MKTMILRRGHDPAYYRFMDITVRANDMTLVIDRRRCERRQGFTPPVIEQRAQERRAEPAPTWTQEGFLIVGA